MQEISRGLRAYSRGSLGRRGIDTGRATGLPWGQILNPGGAGAGQVPIPLWQQGVGKAGEAACLRKWGLARHSTRRGEGTSSRPHSITPRDRGVLMLGDAERVVEGEGETRKPLRLVQGKGVQVPPHGVALTHRATTCAGRGGVEGVVRHQAPEGDWRGRYLPDNGRGTR